MRWLPGVHVLAQQFPQACAGARQAGLGKAFGHAKQIGNFRVVIALHIVQPDHAAVLRFELRKGFGQVFTQLHAAVVAIACCMVFVQFQVVNEAGSLILDCLAKGRSAAETADALAATFEVSAEEALSDVEAFAAELEAAGILEQRPEEGAAACP